MTDLEEFAEAVIAIGLAAPAWARYGERQAYVAALADLMSWPLETFKRQALRAHRAGALELVRGDLAATMDASLFPASAISDGEAYYHFVVLALPRTGRSRGPTYTKRRGRIGM